MKFFIILGIFFVSNFGHAWKVKRLKGSATVLVGGSSKSVKMGDTLEFMSTVTTEKNSRVLVSYEGIDLWLAANTRVLLNKPKKDMLSVLSLTYGKFRAKITKSVKTPRGLKFNLGQAVAGVRGTEFFASSESGEQRLCTLEGSVSLSDASGEVLVPKGFGVKIVSGKEFSVQPNEQLLVQSWVNETSFEESPKFLEYKISEPSLYKLGDNLLFSAELELLHETWTNSDYDKNTNDNEGNSRFSFSALPFLQWGHRGDWQFRLQPILSYYDRHMNSANDLRSLFVDLSPENKSDHRSNFNIHQMSVTKNFESFGELTLGAFPIHWHDGKLLSQERWKLGRTHHRGLRLQSASLAGFYDIIATTCLKEKDMTVADGSTNTCMFGMNFKLPDTKGEIFFLSRRQENSDSSILPIFAQDQSVLDFGYYNKLAFTRANLNMNLYGQKTELENQGVATEKWNTYFDLSYTYFFFGISKNSLQLRHLRASPDYVPGFDEYYDLGLMGRFYRSNKKQYRLKFETLWTDKISAYVEWIETRVVGDSFLGTYNGSEVDEKMGSEYDIAFKWRQEGFAAKLGAFYFKPGEHFNPNTDAAYGSMLELRYLY